RRRACAYCAGVESRGSTRQKAGAAMLVYPDGTQAGTLGGGCVEAEVKRRALHGLNTTGRPEVLSFCLDDDYGWDDGLICGGRMTILAHPLRPDRVNDTPPAPVFTSPLEGEVGEPQASRVGGEAEPTPHPPLRGDLPPTGGAAHSGDTAVRTESAHGPAPA